MIIRCVTIGLAILSLAVAGARCAASSPHLIPTDANFGVSEPFGKLITTTYERSLFTKKPWLIRYYRDDTPVNATIAFSIYSRDKAFWVNLTHATPAMDPLIRRAAETGQFNVSNVLKQVEFKRFDFPIPQSTAVALVSVWRELLAEVRQDPMQNRKIYTEGPFVILFAKNTSGSMVAGRIPPGAEQDGKFDAVDDILTDLMKACAASERKRIEIYHAIEGRAAQVLKTLRQKQE